MYFKFRKYVSSIIVVSFGYEKFLQTKTEMSMAYVYVSLMNTCAYTQDHYYCFFTIHHILIVLACLPINAISLCHVLGIEASYRPGCWIDLFIKEPTDLPLLGQ
jgi:hypothetical protein